jgi:hypothetical protein
LDIATLIGVVLGSNGLFALLTYLIQRHDSRKNGIAAIVEKIDALSNKVDENSAVLARTHILRFSDELQNGIVHSQEYFRQQMDDCDTYDSFCDEHPQFKNSFTVAAERHIKDTYQRLLDKGSFGHEN